MIGIIKTAIITIIISFISGVLLDFYKSSAPKVLCSIKRDKPMMLGGKKINSYSLKIKNISNKTIHELNLNIQGSYDNLKIDDANITKGLKFDISEDDEVYDVSIPFLCKNDEFTAKVFAYSEDGSSKKPFITLRSPEKFKKIYSDSDKENGVVSAICSGVSNHKKAIVAIIAVLVVVYAGITVGEHLGKIGNKINMNNIKNKINSVQKSAGKDNSSNSGTESKGSAGSTITKSSTPSNSKDASSTKSSNEKSQSQSAGSANNNASENKKQENTAAPADKSVDSGKSTDGNGSDKSQPAQQSESESNDAANDGASGNTDTANQAAK